MIKIKYKTVLYNGVEYELPYKTFMGFTILKYRVVTDIFLGYEAQQWKWYYPFWTQLDFSNTNPTLELSVMLINNHINNSNGNNIILE